MREARRVLFLNALDYCALLAVERSERFEACHNYLALAVGAAFYTTVCGDLVSLCVYRSR
jgi:hypothetical protein